VGVKLGFVIGGGIDLDCMVIGLGSLGDFHSMTKWDLGRVSQDWGVRRRGRGYGLVGGFEVMLGIR
jgi:hypothetical protein